MIIKTLKERIGKKQKNKPGFLKLHARMPTREPKLQKAQNALNAKPLEAKTKTEHFNARSDDDNLESNRPEQVQLAGREPPATRENEELNRKVPGYRW